MPQTFGHYRSLAVALGKSGGFDLWAYFAAAARHHALIAASPVTAHPSSQNHGAGREAAVNGCGVVGILRLERDLDRFLSSQYHGSLCYTIP